MTDTVSEIRDAKKAALEMAALGADVRNSALAAMAAALEANRAAVLEANAEDVKEAEGNVPDEILARLKVTDSKISDMVASLKGVAELPDPIGETMSATELDEGLVLYQIRCPIGMIGVIFESRPDVVPQIMALCLKSGNSIAFKGGSEARRSNRALFDILRDAAVSAGVPGKAFVLMETREDIAEILKLDEYIDLLIPRGSYGFVRYIQENTRIPVLGHSAGVCHVYVDSEADMQKALRVALDSKIQYPAVCNAAEKLLVHSKAAAYFLPRMADLFAANGVEMRVDGRCKAHLLGFDVKDASEDDWFAEYDSRIIAIRMVDSADVFINASTRFADGFRFGKGAEVGVSTGKIHARGPMGMEGLTIYKYVLVGKGQTVTEYSGPDAKKYTHRHLDAVYRL